MVESIQKKLFIHAPEDWYDVPKAHLKLLSKDEFKAVQEYPAHSLYSLFLILYILYILYILCIYSKGLWSGGRQGSIAGFAGLAYPAHEWAWGQFADRRVAGQGRLLFSQNLLRRILQHLFPNTPVHTNVRSQLNLRSAKTGAPLEVDLYLPALNLGFEYQVGLLYHGWVIDDF